MAFSGDAEIGRIEGGEHVEIEEAVVERRDQRVGHRMGEPHQISVVAGRIDHHHVVAVLERTDSLREVGEFLRLVGFQRIALGPLHAVMRRQIKRDARALAPGAAVLDVMGETFLPAVEIDGRHALAGLEQRDRNVQSSRGLTRAAFLVAENDHVSGLTSLLDRLDQHDAPLEFAILELLPRYSQARYDFASSRVAGPAAFCYGLARFLRQSADRRTNYGRSPDHRAHGSIAPPRPCAVSGHRPTDRPGADHGRTPSRPFDAGARGAPARPAAWWSRSLSTRRSSRRMRTSATIRAALRPISRCCKRPKPTWCGRRRPRRCIRRALPPVSSRKAPPRPGWRTSSARISLAASPLWWPSCSRKPRPISPCSARRTTSSCASSPRWRRISICR